MSGRGPFATRREFMKTAVAAGGSAALAACLDRSEEPIPTGSGEVPAGQHRWNDFVARDEFDNVTLPRHHLFLYLDLTRDGTPTPADRRTVDEALRGLEAAYQWSNAGLVHSLAFSPRYFSRYDAPLPLDLPEPRALSSFETPTFDRQDALLHLASDRADAVLGAEAALFDDADEANGVEVPALSPFAVSSRRSGFMGFGMPAERQDEVEGVPSGGPVPEESPLFMGFVAGFRRNQASEAYVTLDSGPFDGGTTKHVSRIRQRLDDWYGEQNREQRVAELFSPVHAAEDMVEGIGRNLEDFSGVTADMIERVHEHAEEYGRVGHAEKSARANRDEDGNVKLLRRHVESTDDGVASLHFPSLQRSVADFEAVRKAMNGGDLTDVPTIRQRVNNGILEYIFVKNRGNFLVPPRRLRALPTPDGRAPGL